MRFLQISLITSLHIISFSLTAQSEWHHISTPGLNLLIADNQLSYRYTNEPVGSHGSRYNLYKSVDGGHNFTLVATKTGDMGCYSIDELFVLDAETVFYTENCQGITTIYKSIDGGANWTNTGMGGSFGMSMFFLREDFGYYSFYPGFMNDSYLMRNGTLAFSTTEYVFANGYPNPELRTEIYFKNDSTGLIMCMDSLENSVILKSTNYGNDWIDRMTIGDLVLNDMHFINDSVGFIVGDLGITIKTTDFGETWTHIYHNVANDLFSIDFTESGTGFIAGSDGKLLKSIDEGETWEEINPPAYSDLIYIRAFNSEVIYVLDEDGKLYNNQGGASIVDQSLPSVKAYPNPVAEMLILAIDDHAGLEGIVIYDLMGREIYKTDEKEMDLSHLETGVYVLEARTTKGVVTKRIIKK